MKHLLLLCLGFFAVTLNGQEVVLSFKNEDLSRRINKDSYTMVNAKTKDLALVIIERKEAHTYLFDSNFNQVSSFVTDYVKPKFNKVLGYAIKDNTYRVLYTNTSRKKFAVLSLDFNTKTSTIQDLEFNLDKDELFLECIIYNNELFALTGNNDLELSLRKFNGSNAFDIVKTYTLNEIREETSLINSKIRLGVFLLSGAETSNITKIDTRTPSSIERASNANKLYQDNEHIILTFDNNEESTVLYKINLNTLDFSIKNYPYPKSKVGAFKKFNSFVFEKHLYQTASSKNEMTFEIKDLEGNSLKEFYIHRDKAIDFKNSPIIQEGQTALPFVTTRKLEQTQKYLRKISSGNLGISVQKVRGLYYITLGGFQVIHTGGMMPVTSSSSMPNSFESYNPTYLNYSAYAYTKSTYFNTILNAKFDHLKGELDDNNFDRISSYKETTKYETAEDVFYLNNTLYFGYFNLKESQYNLVKF